MPPPATPVTSTFGASASTLYGPAVTVALLSARSSAVPVRVWLDPVLSTSFPEHVATPEPAAPLAAAGSVHAKPTVTAPLYQPCAPCSPVALAVIVGFVL